MQTQQRLALHLIDEHPVDAARVLQSLPPKESAAFLAYLAPAGVAGVLVHLDPESALAWHDTLPPDRVPLVLQAIPAPAIARMLRRMPVTARQAALDSLPHAKSTAVLQALHAPEDTAGALMDPHFTSLPQDLRVGEALERFRSTADATEDPIHVVDRDQRLVGWVSSAALIKEEPTRSLREVMRSDVPSISALMGLPALLADPSWELHHTIPVVDGHGVLVGVLRHPTLRVLERRARAPRAPGGFHLALDIVEIGWTLGASLLDLFLPTPREPTRRPTDDR